jgi:Arc/MetJ family transcription regulator
MLTLGEDLPDGLRGSAFKNTSRISPFGDINGDMEVSMRATVALDDELVRKAQEYSGVTERTALLRDGLKALIHLEASRRLAAVGGTEPDLEAIKRVRADSL